MGVAAVVPVLKGIGVAASAYSAVKGIKEGNLFQAVLGGVGAYFGATSLMAGSTSNAASMGQTVAEGAAAKTANLAQGMNGAGGMSGMTAGATGGQMLGSAGANALDLAGATKLASGVANGASATGSMGGLLGSLGANANTISNAGSALNLGGGTGFGAAASLANGADAGGVLNFAQKATQGANWMDTFKKGASALNGFANTNPLLSSSIVQVGGGLLSGMGEQRRFDAQLSEIHRQEQEMIRLKEEERRRRALTGDTSFLNNTRFNPATGRFEEIA